MMDLNFLPLPLYIIFCMLLMVLMIFFAISRRRKDRKGLIIIYYTISLLAPFMVIARAFPNYFNLFLGIIYGILFLVFIELTVMAIINIRKGLINKKIIAGLIMIWAIVILYILIFLHLI